MKYKVRRQGEDLGEYTLEELIQRRQTGEFSGGEYVQLDGTTDWQPLNVVIQQGYRTTPPALPPMTAKSSPNYLIIVGLVLAGFILFSVFMGFFVSGMIRMQQGAANLRTRNYTSSAPGFPVAASQKPIVWTTNSATIKDVQKRLTDFDTRQWLTAYQEHGPHNPEAETFLKTLIAREYGGGTETNNTWLETESDKFANDPQCTDPLILTAAGYNNVNFFQANRCFRRALAAYPDSQYHQAYPWLYATLMLESHLDKRPRRAAALEESALQLLSKCFADGSFTPDDQQVIAEILINGWGNGFFERNTSAICTIVHLAGTNYQWLALSLDGEREINAAWAARGDGYVSSVSDQGWKGFNSHLAKARQCLTSAWNLQPMWPLAPERMIYVSLGDSDIDEMRTWFDRTTTAQVDYNRAWSDFRWGLRPRWYGNKESLLAFGKTAVDTGRFDTDVPRKYLDAIRDIESELSQPAGTHIYGRPDVWPDLQRMYQGYLDAPLPAAKRDAWRSDYLVVAYFAGQFDVARTQLAALNWKPWPQSLTGWGADLSQMPLEVAARTGKLAIPVSAAEFQARNGSVADAVKKYTEMASADADSLTKQFVQLRLKELGIAQQLKAGTWVDWLPSEDQDPAWIFSIGQARRLPDGALEVESGAKGHMLFSKIHVGENFEVRGQIENVRSSNKNFQGGLVMGVPDLGQYNWYGFRIKRHDEEGDLVSFSQGWSRNQIAHSLALNDGTNTFDFIFRDGRVTATVNGTKIFDYEAAPQGISVPDQAYLVGLGAFSDSADSVLRYRNVQLRSLN